MADGDRTDKITDRVQLALGITDQDKIPLAHIYETINDAQDELAEKLLCIETSATLTVSSSAVAEPTGFYKMKLIELSSDLWYQPEEISIVDYDYLNRHAPEPPGCSGMYYKRWAGTLTFFPDLADGSYTCYYWKTHTTSVSTSVDPQTPARYDQAIELYSVAYLAPLVGKMDLAMYYKRLYEEALKDAKESQRRTKPGHYQIQYHDV